MRLSQPFLNTRVYYQGAYLPLYCLNQEDLRDIASHQPDFHAEICVQLALKKLHIDDNMKGLNLQKSMLFTQYQAVFDNNIEVLNGGFVPNLDLHAITTVIKSKLLLSLYQNNTCIAKAIWGDNTLYIFPSKPLEISSLPLDCNVVIASEDPVVFWGELNTGKTLQVFAKSIRTTAPITAQAITFHSQETTLLESDLKAVETIELCQPHLSKNADCEAKQILIVSETALNQGAIISEGDLTLLGCSWKDKDQKAVMHAANINQYMTQSLHQQGQVSTKKWHVIAPVFKLGKGLFIAEQTQFKMHIMSTSKVCTLVTSGDVTCNSTFEAELKGRIASDRNVTVEGIKVTIPSEFISPLYNLPTAPNRPYLKPYKPQKIALARYLSSHVLGAKPGAFKPGFVKRCEKAIQPPINVSMFSLSADTLSILGWVTCVDTNVTLDAKKLNLMGNVFFLHYKQDRLAVQMKATKVNLLNFLLSTVNVGINAHELTQYGLMQIPGAALSIQGHSWRLEMDAKIKAKSISAALTGSVKLLPRSLVEAEHLYLKARSAYLRGYITGKELNVKVKRLALMTGNISSLKQSYQGSLVLFLGALVSADEIDVMSIFSGMLGLFCTGRLKVASVFNLSLLISIQTAITNPSLSMLVSAAIGIGCVITMILVPKSVMIIPFVQLGLMGAARILNIIQILHSLVSIIKQIKQQDSDGLGLSIQLLTVLASFGSLILSSGMAAIFIDLSPPNVDINTEFSLHQLLTGGEEIINVLVSAIAGNRQTTAAINLSLDPFNIGLGEFTTSLLNFDFRFLNLAVSSVEVSSFQLNASALSAHVQESVTAIATINASVLNQHLSQSIRTAEMLMVGSVVPGLPRTRMNVEVAHDLWLIRPEKITQSQLHFGRMDIVGGDATITTSDLQGKVIAPHHNEFHTQSDSMSIKTIDIQKLWYDAGSKLDIQRLTSTSDSIIVYYSNHTSIHEMETKGQFLAFAPNPKDGSLDIVTMTMNGGEYCIDNLQLKVKLVDAKNGAVAVISSSDAAIGGIEQDEKSTVEFIKARVDIKKVDLNGESWFILEATTGNINVINHAEGTVVSTQYSDALINEHHGPGKLTQHGDTDLIKPDSNYDFTTGILTYTLPTGNFDDVAEVYGVRTLRFISKADMQVATTGFKCYAPLILQSTEGNVIFKPKAVVMANELQVVAFGDIKGQGAILMSNGRLALIAENGNIYWDPYTVTTTTRRKIHHWFFTEWVTETHTTVISGIIVSQNDKIEIWAPKGSIDVHAAYVHASGDITFTSQGNINLIPTIANHSTYQKRLGLLGFSSGKHTWQTAHPTVLISDNGNIIIYTNGKATLGGADIKAKALTVKAKEISMQPPSLTETLTTRSFTIGPTLNGVLIGPNLSSAWSLVNLSNAYAQFGAFMQAQHHSEQAITVWNTANEIGNFLSKLKHNGYSLPPLSFGFQIGYTQSHATQTTIAPAIIEVEEVTLNASQSITMDNGQSIIATNAISMAAPKIMISGGNNTYHATSFAVNAFVSTSPAGLEYGGSFSYNSQNETQRVMALINAPNVHIETDKLTLDGSKIEAKNLSGHANTVTAITRLSESNVSFFSISGSNTSGTVSFGTSCEKSITGRAGIEAEVSTLEINAFEGQGAEVSDSVHEHCEHFSNTEVHESHHDFEASVGVSFEPDNSNVTVCELGLNGPAFQMPGSWLPELFQSPPPQMTEETVVMVTPEIMPSIVVETSTSTEITPNPTKPEETKTPVTDTASPDETAPKSLYDLLNIISTEKVAPVLEAIEPPEVTSTNPADIINTWTTSNIAPDPASTYDSSLTTTNPVNILNQLSTTYLSPYILNCGDSWQCVTFSRTIKGLGNAAESYLQLFTDPYHHVITPVGGLLVDIEIVRPGSVPNQILIVLAPEAISLARGRLIQRAMMPIDFVRVFLGASYGDRVEITATFFGSLSTPAAFANVPKTIIMISQGAKLPVALLNTMNEFVRDLPHDMVHHIVPSALETIKTFGSDTENNGSSHTALTSGGLRFFGQVIVPPTSPTNNSKSPMIRH